MRIAAATTLHSNPELVLDTFDSIFAYMTTDVLAVIDGASSAFRHVPLPVHHITGVEHNCNRAPYRNVAIALKEVAGLFPTCDWYCYIEPDCLVVSDRFKTNLRHAEEKDVWMLGCDGRVEAEVDLSFLETVFGKSLKGSGYYLLGCCQFFKGSFLRQIVESGFFERFLTATADCSNGYVPNYNGYDISEHLYPTLARSLGGNLGVFATYESTERWHGSYRVFPMRWRPELSTEEDFPESSIMHPLKSVDHPIRVERRRIRNAVRAAENARLGSRLVGTDRRKQEGANHHQETTSRRDETVH
jgi:hypothetical protein